jgi:addiction module HigA family antidote
MSKSPTITADTLQNESTIVAYNLNRVRTHPGEVLREEFLDPLGLSSSALAAALDVPANRISMIVRERRGITGDTALRLARYFGTTPQFWMTLQANYDLSAAEAAAGAAIRRSITPRPA